MNSLSLSLKCQMKMDPDKFPVGVLIVCSSLWPLLHSTLSCAARAPPLCNLFNFVRVFLVGKWTAVKNLAACLHVRPRAMTA
jgi:hypothetical protein